MNHALTPHPLDCSPIDAANAWACPDSALRHRRLVDHSDWITQDGRGWIGADPAQSRSTSDFVERGILR